MRKFLVMLLLLLCAVGMAACNEQKPAEPNGGQTGEALLKLEEYPRVDGSTANLPMMAQIMADSVGITLAEAEQLTSCRKTADAWLALAEGDADLLLVYEAAEMTKQQLAEIGTELTIEPIGRDALVFIVNEDNPVQS